MVEQNQKKSLTAARLDKVHHHMRESLLFFHPAAFRPSHFDLFAVVSVFKDFDQGNTPLSCISTHYRDRCFESNHKATQHPLSTRDKSFHISPHVLPSP